MSLSSDERVIYSTRFSKRIFVKPFVVSAIAMILAFVFKGLAREYSHFFFWTFIALAILSVVSPFTRYLFSQFVVTTSG